MKPLQPGDPVQVGGIRLLARLGSGGFGDVYLGRSRLDRWVAVKILRDPTSDPSALERFAREARAAGRVSTPFVAEIAEVSVSGDPPFIVAEFIPGPTLLEGRDRVAPLSTAELRAMAVGLAQALSELSAVGLTHRDVKPANVILGERGPVLVDLGIARSEDASTVTVQGGVIGTPAWMSPEQASGSDVGPSTDVWAWARTMQWATQNLAGSGPRDEELDSLIAACLVIESSQRPLASELVRQLAGGESAVGYVTERWGRIAGYARGSEDSLKQMLEWAPTIRDGSVPPTAVDPSWMIPTQVARAVTPEPRWAYREMPPAPLQVETPHRNRTGVTIAVVTGVILLVLAAGIGGVYAMGQAGLLAPTTPGPAASPAPVMTLTQPAPIEKTVTATATATAILTPEPPTPVAPVVFTEQDAANELQWGINAQDWTYVNSLCSPTGVCQSQFTDFFAPRFAKGQWLDVAIGPLYSCAGDLPTGWSQYCQDGLEWLATFDNTCSKNGSVGVDYEIAAFRFTSGDVRYISQFRSAKVLQGASECY